MTSTTERPALSDAELELRVVNVTSSAVQESQAITYSAEESDNTFSIPLETLGHLSKGQSLVSHWSVSHWSVPQSDTFSVCVCLSVCLSIYICIYLTYTFIHLPAYLPTYISIYPPTYTPTHSPTHSPTHLHTHSCQPSRISRESPGF